MSQTTARQLDGGHGRQSGDTEGASGAFPTATDMSPQFFEENLRQMALPALTLEAVRPCEGPVRQAVQAHRPSLPGPVKGRIVKGRAVLPRPVTSAPATP